MKIVDMVSDWRFKRWCIVTTDWNKDAEETLHNHLIKQFHCLEEAEEYLKSMENCNESRG